MSPDDLAPGLLVTVREWYSNLEQDDGAAAFSDMAYLGFGSGREKRKPNNSHKGEVLRVEAVALPYVALRVAFKNKIILLDVREVEFGRVTPEYVSVMRMRYAARAKNRGANPSGTITTAVGSVFPRLLGE